MGEEKELLVMLHGSRNLKENNIIEIQESKKGKYEYGAGFYLTTSYTTARKYARNSNQVWEIYLEPPKLLKFTDTLPLEEIEDFIHSQHRMKGKSKVLKDIQYYAIKNEKIEKFPIEVLLNTLVNNDCLSGAYGVNFTKWLTKHGFDAIKAIKSGEDWLIIFNPKIITTFNRIKDYDDKPSLAEQLKTIEEKKLLNSEIQQIKMNNKLKIA